MKKILFVWLLLFSVNSLSEKTCVSDEEWSLILEETELVIRSQLQLEMNYSVYMDDIVQLSMLLIVGDGRLPVEVVESINRGINSNFSMLKAGYTYIDSESREMDKLNNLIRSTLNLREKYPSGVGDEILYELAELVGSPITNQSESGQ